MPKADSNQTELARELQRKPVLRNAMIATAGAVIVLMLAAVVWFARVPILLAFGGVLLAIVLHGGSRAICHYTGIPRLIALAALLIVIVCALAAVIVSAGPTLVSQTTELARSVGAGLSRLSREVLNLSDGQALFEANNIQEFLGRLQPWGIATGATAFAGNVLGVIAGLFIVLFFGIYVAADPDTHVKLLSRLASPDDRPATVTMLNKTGDVLRRWLIGQGIAMTAIGCLTYVGLLILGVPMAFALALFAALAGFLPYLGPIIGAVPMVLVAGGDSLELALYVMGLYLIVQGSESYLLTPLIQSRAVSLPPAIVILSQLVLGAVFGILGIALATPLVAAATVPLRHWFGPADEDAAR